MIYILSLSLLYIRVSYAILGIHDDFRDRLKFSFSYIILEIHGYYMLGFSYVILEIHDDFRDRLKSLVFLILF